MDNRSGACPVCGHAMSEHTIDHSTPNAVLHCPVAYERPAPSTEHLNELGMTKLRRP
ncbi:MAG TPA: hypothetical protein VFM95_08865 [Microcella sp.]|nr:hypothetical protein [Microcella sp.]